MPAILIFNPKSNLYKEEVLIMGDAVGKEEANVNPSLVHIVTLVYGRILVIDTMRETILKYIPCGG